jgi:hypothetical protein
MANRASHAESSWPLSCYDCGHDYWFLGETAHRGQCPRCGSRLVTPAGDLRIVTSQPVDTDEGDAALRLTGTDDSTRLFQYWFRADDEDETTCTRIDVCGYSLEPTRDDGWPPALFPPSVKDAAERARSTTGQLPGTD